MKKRNYLLLLLLFIINSSIAQIGIGTTAPDAQLDIRSSNQATPANNDGILIPKVDAFPATNPTAAQQGMLVYLTTATTFGGNPKPIGFYYWDNVTPDWVGISSAANGDHDWYEVGTTTAPNAITDDMFHTGNVAIGKNTADYPLEVETTNFTIGINNDFNNPTTIGAAKVAIRNSINDNTTDSKYGILNDVITNNTSSAGVGVRNNVSGSGNQLFANSNFVNGLTNASDIIGVRNDLSTSTNSSTLRGNYNLFSGSGNNLLYGSYNDFNNPVTNRKFGTYNNFYANSEGFNVGLYNDLNCANTVGTDQYGVWNNFNVTTNLGDNYGIYNFFSGSGNSSKIGSYTNITNSGNGYHSGSEINIAGTGNGGQYGISTTITNTGNAPHYGIANRLTTSGTGIQQGTFNTIAGIGNGVVTGTYNQINNTGSGDKIGTQNDIGSNVATNHYGVKNNLTGTGAATKYGVRNDFTSNGASINYGVFSSITGNSNGSQYGINNSITNTGNGFHYGINNDMTANGAGQRTGVKNTITNNNATIIYGVDNSIVSGGIPYGINNNISNSNAFGGSATYGVYNYLQGTSNGQYFALSNLIDANGTGAKYGFFSRITTTSGGTHYGVYSEVLRPGATNFAGYFLGNVGIGTTAANTYTFPPSRGTINQIMVTDGTGVVSWQNASAVQDHDWYEVGTLLAPDAITDVMFHTGNVSVGKNTNTYPLDVTSATRTINSVSTLGTSAAVFGFNTAALGASGGGYGVAGQTSQSSSQAVRGEQLNTSGYAIGAINFGASGAGTGGGTYCQTTQSAGFGLDTRNLNASGTAMISTGQNTGGTYLIAGSGGSFNGTTTGLHARSTTAGAGEGIYTEQFGTVARVNYWNGTTQFKIIGTGTVSTTAENTNGERVTLYCPEAPEILFEDYGQSQLVNGSVHIEIDPTIAKNIVVNDKHPLRVYIQLEDDCKGVYVTNKTGNSFDVIELASGQSNAKFQYHIVGNRADEVLPNGRISKNADMRFEPAPKDRETREATAVDVGKPATVK